MTNVKAKAWRPLIAFYIVITTGFLAIMTGCSGAGLGVDGGITDRSAAPVITPEGGVHYLMSGSSLMVSLISPSAAAEIFFTLDGTLPTVDSIRYSGPFLLNGSGAVRAVAIEPGRSQSNFAEALFIFQAATQAVAPPLISPAGGVRSNATQVSITSATVDADIFYTTDGSLPYAGSEPYTAPFTIDAPTEVVRAVAIKAGEERSLSEESYSFITAEPVLRRRGQWEGYWDANDGVISNGGVFGASYFELPSRGTSLTAGSATSGAEIRFTVDGSIPDENSILYTGRMMVWWDGSPGNLRVGGNLVTSMITPSTGMKARAFREGYEPSPVVTMGFSTDAPTPTPH